MQACVSDCLLYAKTEENAPTFWKVHASDSEGRIEVEIEQGMWPWWKEIVSKVSKMKMLKSFWL